MWAPQEVVKLTKKQKTRKLEQHLLPFSDLFRYWDQLGFKQNINVNIGKKGTCEQQLPFSVLG